MKALFVRKTFLILRKSVDKLMNLETRIDELCPMFQKSQHEVFCDGNNIIVDHTKKCTFVTFLTTISFQAFTSIAIHIINTSAIIQTRTAVAFINICIEMVSN